MHVCNPLSQALPPLSLLCCSPVFQSSSRAIPRLSRVNFRSLWAPFTESPLYSVNIFSSYGVPGTWWKKYQKYSRICLVKQDIDPTWHRTICKQYFIYLHQFVHISSVPDHCSLPLKVLIYFYLTVLKAKSKSVIHFSAFFKAYI